jgi:hypothetical protein
MPHTAEFAPDNQNRSLSVDLADQADAIALETLERGRKDILQVTNYLEALYARLLTESAEATALKLVADETPPNPIQSV